MSSNANVSIKGITYVFKISMKEDDEDFLLDELEEKGCKYVSDWIVYLDHYSNTNKNFYTENELTLINIEESSELDVRSYQTENKPTSTLFYSYNDKKPEIPVQRYNIISYKGDIAQIVKTLGLQISQTKKIVGKTYVLKDIKISEGILNNKDKVAKDLIIKIEIPAWTSYRDDVYENFGSNIRDIL